MDNYKPGAHYIDRSALAISSIQLLLFIKLFTLRTNRFVILRSGFFVTYSFLLLLLSSFNKPIQFNLNYLSNLYYILHWNSYYWCAITTNVLLPVSKCPETSGRKQGSNHKYQSVMNAISNIMYLLSQTHILYNPLFPFWSMKTRIT